MQWNPLDSSDLTTPIPMQIFNMCSKKKDFKFASAKEVGDEIVKLYVEPFFYNQNIGGQLIEFAKEKGYRRLWALEKNIRAIAFYNRHGFKLNGNRKLEEGTPEYLVELTLSK